MKLKLSSLLPILLFFGILQLKSQNLSPHAPDQLLIKIKANIPFAFNPQLNQFNHPEIDRLNQQFGIKKIEALLPSKILPNKKNRPATERLFLFHFKKQHNLQELIHSYLATRLFEYVEPNYIGMGSGFFNSAPNDSLLNRQWAIINDGTFRSTATIGADIDMDKAWDITTGNRVVVTAILDTGTKLNHPEFNNRIWKNRNEILNNGVDDDGNGFIDDYQAWDFVNEDDSPTDDHGHGSNISGILGATGNNKIGYAGIDWNCQLMILKILDKNNIGYYSDWVRAVYYAIENGADVINISAGGTGLSTSLKEAIDFAFANNVVVVCSMMNSGDNKVYYPAAFEKTIAVGATSYDDQRAEFSNYGNHIDLMAPGVNIYGLSKNSNQNYDLNWSGTSMASPHVAGVASLLKGLDQSLDVNSIRSILRNSADDLIGLASQDTKGWDQYYGAGRLNAFAALSSIATPQEKPDLELQRLSGLSTTQAGAVGYFTFDLVNHGPAIAEKDYTIGAYLATSDTLDSFAILAGTVPTGNTPVGTISSVQGAITIPDKIEGNYFLVLKVDSEDDIFEHNENNNIITKPIEFIKDQDLTDEGNVDLELNLTANTTTLRLFQDYQLTFTVSNKGNKTASNVIIEIPHPDELAYTNHEPSQGHYTPWDDFTWHVGTIEAGKEATLKVVMFSLEIDQPITIWGQVKSQDDTDVDSTPDNAICCDFVEDDEAGLTISNVCTKDSDNDGICEADDNCPYQSNVNQADSNQNGIGDVCEHNLEADIDLEMTLSVDNNNLEIFQNYTFTLSVINKGPKEAHNISAQFFIPNGMVYTSHQTSNGQYINWNDFLWVIGSLDVGQTATLELVLFTLVGEGTIQAYSQIVSVHEQDMDSTPNNGEFPIAKEDDEATVNLEVQAAFGIGASASNKRLRAAKFYKLYPNPSPTSIHLIIEARAVLPVRLEWYNVQGKLVDTKHLELIPSPNHFEFNINH